MNKNEIMSRAGKIVGKASFQLKKHSPEILVVEVARQITAGAEEMGIIAQIGSYSRHAFHHQHSRL